MRLNKNKRVEFDNFTHTYILDGEKVLLGVTSLMKKHGLSPDYSAISPEVLAKAAERGSAIHKLLEDYDNGKPVTEDENLKAYKTLGLNVHASEYLVSDNELIASSIDKVLEDCSLADVKTTSTIHTKSVSWQLSIYAYLFEKANPRKKVPHLYCIHVRDGNAKLVEVPRIADEQVIELLNAHREGRIFKEQKHQADEVLPIEQMETLIESMEKIAQLKSVIKQLESANEQINEQIKTFMEERNITELECNLGIFTLTREYVRETLDSTKLKKECPEVFEKYKKESVVKGSIKYKSFN